MLNSQHGAVIDEPGSYEQLPGVLHLKAIIASHHGITIQSNDQLQLFRILHLGLLIECDRRNGYSDFELHLRPTNDFYTPLLSRGPNIKVLEPEWLVEEIKVLVERMGKLYE